MLLSNESPWLYARLEAGATEDKPWQRPPATPYLAMSEIEDTPDLGRHCRTARTRRSIASDRGGRQAFSGAPVARHGKPRLHGDFLRQRRRWARPDRQVRAGICGGRFAARRR